MAQIMVHYTSLVQKLIYYRIIQLLTQVEVEFILNQVQQIIKFIQTQYLQVIFQDYMFNLQIGLLLEIILFQVQEIMELRYPVLTEV